MKSRYSFPTSQVFPPDYTIKLLKGDDWKSLSIPKGQSGSYNSDKFGKDKTTKHFTDEGDRLGVADQVQLIVLVLMEESGSLEWLKKNQ